jgi:hypothetical protein
VRQHQRDGPTTPVTQRLPAVPRDRFSLFRFRSPLLTESRLFSPPVGNEMFHFPTFPPLTLCVQVRVTGHDSCRVSPFGDPRINARLAAPRGLSQPPTSFFGSWCQGIHRAPLLTWPQRFKMLASTVQFSRSGRDRDPFSPRHPRTRFNVGRRPFGADHTRRKRARAGPKAGRLSPQDPTACPGCALIGPGVPLRAHCCTRRY